MYSLYIYQVSKDSEYPKNKCLMHGYLIQKYTCRAKYTFLFIKQEI